MEKYIGEESILLVHCLERTCLVELVNTVFLMNRSLHSCCDCMYVPHWRRKNLPDMNRPTIYSTERYDRFGRVSYHHVSLFPLLGVLIVCVRTVSVCWYNNMSFLGATARFCRALLCHYYCSPLCCDCLGSTGCKPSLHCYYTIPQPCTTRRLQRHGGPGPGHPLPKQVGHTVF